MVYNRTALHPAHPKPSWTRTGPQHQPGRPADRPDPTRTGLGDLQREVPKGLEGKAAPCALPGRVEMDAVDAGSVWGERVLV